MGEVSAQMARLVGTFLSALEWTLKEAAGRKAAGPREKCLVMACMWLQSWIHHHARLALREVAMEAASRSKMVPKHKTRC